MSKDINEDDMFIFNDKFRRKADMQSSTVLEAGDTTKDMLLSSGPEETDATIASLGLKINRTRMNFRLMNFTLT